MLNTVKSFCIIILFFFIVLYVFLRLNGPIPFFINGVQTTKNDIFHAQGTGKVTAVPNTAIVTFSVVITASSITSAQNQVNTKVNTILSGLNDLGIQTSDITTTNYSVNPQYDPEGQNRITGYTAQQDMQVKLQPIDKANNAIDSLTKNGATDVSTGDLTFDDATYTQLQQQAREKAVADAKNKAQSLAKAAGIRLGNIVDVTDDENQPYPQPIMANAPIAAGRGSQPTNITPGKGDITATVTLSYLVY